MKAAYPGILTLLVAMLLCTRGAEGQPSIFSVTAASGGPVAGAGVVARLAIGQPAAGSMQLGDMQAGLGFAPQVLQLAGADQVGTASEGEAEVPAEFRLHQNYPNPFNPATTIRYAVPEPSRVSIFVYDVLGRRVAVLVDEALAAGRYEATWDAGRASSGVYLYVLRSENTVRTRRMILSK